MGADRQGLRRPARLSPRTSRPAEPSGDTPLAGVPAPATLDVAFPAGLRARGFEGSPGPSDADRAALSTDSSIHRLFPQAIALPKNVGDLVRVARLATWSLPLEWIWRCPAP